jgi:hypothetical protein
VAADTERWKKVVREAQTRLKAIAASQSRLAPVRLTIGSRRTRLSASILPSFWRAGGGFRATASIWLEVTPRTASLPGLAQNMNE